VGIREIEEKIWLVSFMHYNLGFFDHETGRVECADNPFEAKVLAVSMGHRSAQNGPAFIGVPRDVKARLKHGFPWECLLNHQRITGDKCINRVGGNVTKRAGFGQDPTSTIGCFAEFRKAVR